MDDLMSSLKSDSVLPEHILKELKRWVASSRSVRIFVTGKTGTGKSTLVNALVGRDVAEVGGGADAVTKKACHHETTIDGIRLIIWDTPGLQESRDLEQKYLTDMQSCGEFDLALYCINISVARFNKDRADIAAMKSLTDRFGQKIWKNAIFVLTFANEVEAVQLKDCKPKQLKSQFTSKVQEFEGMLQNTLERQAGVDQDIARSVIAVPAGHCCHQALPDRGHWLSALWFSCLYRMKCDAQPAMIQLNIKRILQSQSKVRRQDLEKFVHEQPIIMAEKGSQIAERYGDKELGALIGLDAGVKRQHRLVLLINVARYSGVLKIEDETKKRCIVT